jgi:DNA-binding response OmpR family regulator
LAHRLHPTTYGVSTSPTTDGDLQQAERRPGFGLRILVVDDSPHLGDVLVSALEHEGCSAVVARSLPQAEHLAGTLAPDLITIDVEAGGRIGPEGVARLGCRDVPLIVIAPNAREFQRPPGQVVRVFGKPFYLAEVVAAVLETLGRATHP